MAFCAISASAATYTQTVPGHNGPMTVKVAIDSGKITAVEVVKHNETPGVGTKAIETLPAKIVKANSTKVDAVTGASVSSKGILMAVNQALDASQGKKVGKAQFKPGTYKAQVYGNNGYLSFTDDWFDEYMFRVVIRKCYLDEKAVAALATEPVILPAWDFMH